jgi:hypothetical protein
MQILFVNCSLDFIVSCSFLHTSISSLVLEILICYNNLMASYGYNFDSNFWSAVYKHTYGKDFKFKAGYDSEVRLGWASLWVSFC